MQDSESGKVRQVTTQMDALHLESQIKYETETMVEYEFGFLRVVEIIIKLKKPLIGHNMFLDIMYLY